MTHQTIKIIANRYAKAFFSLYQENSGKYTISRENAILLRNFFIQNPDIKSHLSSSILQKNDFIDIIQEILSEVQNPDHFIILFVMLKISKRFDIVDQILDDYILMIDKFLRDSRADLITAFEMSQDELQKIQKHLEKSAGLGNLRLHSKVNPSILGGFIIRHEYDFIDLSYNSRLNQFNNEYN